LTIQDARVLTSVARCVGHLVERVEIWYQSKALAREYLSDP
jgi:hypothetical protein